MAATRLKRENVRIYQTDKLRFLKKASEDRGVRHDLSEAFFVSGVGIYDLSMIDDDV